MPFGFHLRRLTSGAARGLCRAFAVGVALLPSCKRTTSDTDYTFFPDKRMQNTSVDCRMGVEDMSVMHSVQAL
ncbi:hypothetical protein C8R43DRAFT_1135605 [Mycena crocata]|nr:hypothetical protein C8R43DRAFT_1135605 [Mycena crocata]